MFAAQANDDQGSPPALTRDLPGILRRLKRRRRIEPIGVLRGQSSQRPKSLSGSMAASRAAAEALNAATYSRTDVVELFTC